MSGRFVVNAFDMIFLLFIVDFVSLTISTDTVSSSKNPENWNIRPLAKKGCILGLLNTLEAFVWYFIGGRYLGIKDVDVLHSFGFLILFFTGIFNMIIIRTSGRFYKQPIGRVFLYAIIADVTVVVFFVTIGITGLIKLSLVTTCVTLLYFTFCSFVINDWIKIRVN